MSNHKPRIARAAAADAGPRKRRLRLQPAQRPVRGCSLILFNASRSCVRTAPVNAPGASPDAALDHDSCLATGCRARGRICNTGRIRAGHHRRSAATAAPTPPGPTHAEERTRRVHPGHHARHRYSRGMATAPAGDAGHAAAAIARIDIEPVRRTCAAATIPALDTGSIPSRPRSRLPFPANYR